jgi:hypothetical protein
MKHRKRVRGKGVILIFIPDVQAWFVFASYIIEVFSVIVICV